VQSQKVPEMLLLDQQQYGRTPKVHIPGDDFALKFSDEGNIIPSFN
jgi:hypothetical protein